MKGLELSTAIAKILDAKKAHDVKVLNLSYFLLVDFISGPLMPGYPLL